MAMFHVALRRSGPDWDPALPLEEQSGWVEHAAFMDGLSKRVSSFSVDPLADDQRVVHVVEAESEGTVRTTLARDPWSYTHLRIDAIDPWTIRVDGRSA